MANKDVFNVTKSLISSMHRQRRCSEYTLCLKKRTLRSRKTKDIQYAFNAASSSCRRASFLQLFQKNCFIPIVSTLYSELIWQYYHYKNCLKCDNRICTLWNWEKNGCRFTMWTSVGRTKKQDAQLSQRDRAAGCVTVFAKSRRLELGDNILRTL